MIAPWLPLIGLLVVTNVGWTVPLKMKQGLEGPIVVYHDMTSAEEFDAAPYSADEFDEISELGRDTTVENGEIVEWVNETTETKPIELATEIPTVDVSNVTQIVDETQPNKTTLGFPDKETSNEDSMTTIDSTSDVQTRTNLLEVTENESNEAEKEAFNETQTIEESPLEFVNNAILAEYFDNATQDSNETQTTENTSKLLANEITASNMTDTTEALNQTEANEMTTELVMPFECETNFQCDLEELKRTGSCLCGKYVNLPEEGPVILEGELNQTAVPPTDEQLQNTDATPGQANETKQHEDQSQSEDAVVMETTGAQDVTSESVINNDLTESADVGQTKDENLVKLLLDKLLHKSNRPSVRLNDYQYVTALKSFDGSLYVPQNHEQSTRDHLATLFGFVEKILKTQNTIADSDEASTTETHLSTTEAPATSEASSTLLTVEPHETSKTDQGESESTVNQETGEAQTTTLSVVGVLNELGDSNDHSPVVIASTTPAANDTGNKSMDLEDSFSTETVPPEVSENSSGISTELSERRWPNFTWLDGGEQNDEFADEWLMHLKELGLRDVEPSSNATSIDLDSEPSR